MVYLESKSLTVRASDSFCWKFWENLAISRSISFKSSLSISSQSIISNLSLAFTFIDDRLCIRADENWKLSNAKGEKVDAIGLSYKSRWGVANVEELPPFPAAFSSLTWTFRGVNTFSAYLISCSKLVPTDMSLLELLIARIISVSEELLKLSADSNSYSPDCST